MPTKRRRNQHKILKKLLRQRGYKCEFCKTRVVQLRAISADVRLIQTRTHVTYYVKSGDCKTTAIASLEHVLPLSAGGTYDFSNLKIACVSCNSKRNDQYLRQQLEPVKPVKAGSQSPLVLPVVDRACSEVAVTAAALRCYACGHIFGRKWYRKLAQVYCPNCHHCTVERYE